MWILGILLTATNIYRAATQSFTIDESFTFLHFTSQGLKKIFLGPYDANHHFLFTLFSLWAKTPLGWSEIVLRIPTLIAGLALLILLALIVRRLLGDTWKAFLCYTALVLNPLLLDHMSAARGYGCGLAFWCAALWLLMQTLDEPDNANAMRTRFAGWCLAFAVAANLSLLFAVTGLTISYFAVKRPLRFYETSIRLGAPVIFCLLFLLAFPMRTADGTNFYFGDETLAGTLKSVVEASFRPAVYIPNFYKTLSELARGLVVIAGVASIGLWLFPKRFFSKNNPSHFIGTTLVATFALYMGAHWIADVKYPLLRTALILVILVFLATAALWRIAPTRIVNIVAVTVLTVLLVGHALSFRTDYYGEWRTDADIKTLSKHLRTELKNAAGPQKLCASWEQEAAWNYYIQRYHLPFPSVIRYDWIDCTYYSLLPDDQNLIQENDLEVVMSAPRSSTVLAKRRQK